MSHAAKAAVDGIDISMNNEELMKTARWQQIRWFVYDREGGICKICGRPGIDTHHLSYKYGFFEPRVIILVCRPCHLIWQGEDPDHLSPDHPLRSKLFQIATIARSLKGTTCTSGGKMQPTSPADLPEWARQMMPAVEQVYISGVRKLMAPPFSSRMNESARAPDASSAG